MADFSNSQILTEKIFASDEGELLYRCALDAVLEYGMTDIISGGVLVGFSGGADSVFLVLFLLEYKRRNSLNFGIKLCHVNHMIRAGEADRDETFSLSFANSHNLPIEVIRRDVPAFALEFGLGTEEAARRIRYASFESLLLTGEYSCICVAHNASDNAETVIFNLLRGSGTKGASGISPVRNNILRPLIRIPGTDIRKFLNDNNIEFVFDSSNDSDEYTRNYIRHHIIASMREICGNLEESFTRFTDIQREDSVYLDSNAKNEFLRLRAASELNVCELRNLPKPIFYRVVSFFVDSLSSKSVSRKQILTAYELVNNKDNFEVFFSGGVILECQRGICVFKTSDCIEASVSYPLRWGVNHLDGYNADVVITDACDVSFRNVYKFSTEAVILDDIIVEDLFLRFKLDGDSYRYGGITHKLKKVFNDRNIPPRERSYIPVICDSCGILWVPGLPQRDVDSKKSDRKIKIILGLREKCGDEKDIFTAKQRKRFCL